MKNILKLTLILSIFIFSSSCEKEETEKEETLESLENQSMTFDEFFEKISNMDIQTSEENSIYIKYKWNKSNNSISIISSEEKELSWGAAFAITSLKIKNNSNFQKKSFGGNFQVSCSNGDKSWDKECDGKWSCGTAISECLNDGGCAEICALELEYYAPERILFLDSKTLDDLGDEIYH